MNKNSLLYKLMLICACICAAAMLAAFAGCQKTGANAGGRLASNICRIYEHDARKSHFMLNDIPIEGDVTGMAFMETSAEGRTSLAWVGTNLYFVSEKGIDKLASGVDTAEISFDGRVAVWLDAGQVKKYCVDDRSTTVLAEGVAKLVQCAISPNSKTMILDVIYDGDEEETNVSLLCNEQGVEEYSRSIICFAVSDDADIVYYYDGETRGFTVKQGDEVYLISKKLKGTSSYNFSRNLREVTFDDSNDVNHLFCLDTKNVTDLGSGFGYTEKSDVFSISTITYFTYINDIESFRSGFWTARTNVEDKYYTYSLGYIEDSGEIRWVVNDAAKTMVQPDQSRAVWKTSEGSLMSIEAKAGASAVKLADNVASFDSSADGSRVWYTDNGGMLYTVKGAGKSEQIMSGVQTFASIGDTCAVIGTSGRLYYVAGSKKTDVDGISGCVRFDKRAGMLIMYANESKADDDTTVYDAYISGDGKTFKLMYHGVEP